MRSVDANMRLAVLIAGMVVIVDVAHQVAQHARPGGCGVWVRAGVVAAPAIVPIVVDGAARVVARRQVKGSGL